MQVNVMQTAAKIRQATMSARAATGMNGIGTRTESGKFQVVNVTYQGKKTIVDEYSGWLSADAAIETLKQIEMDRAFRG